MATLSWDEIGENLLKDDANKPADLNTDASTGDEGFIKDEQNKEEKEDDNVDPKNDNADNNADDKGDNKDDSDSGDSIDEDAGDDSKQDPPANDEAEGEKKKEELSPFHEHPDWKKMVNEKKELEDKLGKVEAQIEVLTKVSPKKEEEIEVAKQTAKDKAKAEIDRKIGEGWEPKSQQELSEAYIETYDKYAKEDIKEIIAEDKAKEKEAATKAVAEQEQLKKDIDTAFDESGVSAVEDKKKVVSQVLEWGSNGLPVTPATIKIASEQLKLKGEILKATPKGQSDETKQKRNDLSSKISKGKSNSGNSNKGSTKPDYKYIKNHSLDEMVTELGESLG